MSEKTKKEKSGLVTHIAAPFIIAALCAGIMAIALIKPYDKLKMYMGIAFMDSLKGDPDSDSSGLVIRENDIITDYSGETSDTGDVVRPRFGELYAVLSCDAFSLDIPVYWGSNPELLELGACQASGSAVIGTDGNAVISAHIDTYFAEMDKLSENDEITLSTNYGAFTYRVRELISFAATDRKYVVPSDDTHLTLYTCRRDILGSSDQRFGVVCDLTGSSFYTSGEGAEQ